VDCSIARSRGLALLLIALLAAPAQAQDDSSRIVGASGLPLPRFASLASNQVNVRTGPSLDHPIRWSYARSGLPVQIVEESELWRRVVDPDGETGWAHSSLLSIQRTVMVLGPDNRELRRTMGLEGRVVARLEPGVIAAFDHCDGDWCRIEVASEVGWIPRSAIWGVDDHD
jgi:SH3-like domain-containing protein